MKWPVFAKYLAYQVPGWILLILALLLIRELYGLSRPVAAGVFVAWLVKDLLLFPLLRGAYETGPSAIERLIGETGTAVEDLAPAGYIRVRGELWRAEAPDSDQPIAAGRPVTVTGVRGSVLLVAARAGGTSIRQRRSDGR